MRRHTDLSLVMAVLALAAVLPGAVVAAPGDLDTSFGTQAAR
jgi:hypothetical protein